MQRDVKTVKGGYVMNFIKKQAAGFYLTLLAMILGTAGVVFYVINCNTEYFSNLGISWGFCGDLFQ